VIVGASTKPPSSRDALVAFWPVLWDILKIGLGGLAAFLFTRWNERQKAAVASALDRQQREDAEARERRNREESERCELLRHEAEERRADEQIRRAIATDVTSIRSRLFPIILYVSPSRPATPEQIERVSQDAGQFRRHIDRLADLRDNALQQTVLMWYLNLDRAADDLAALSTEEKEPATERERAFRAALGRMPGGARMASKQRLQSLLNDGANLELIFAVYQRQGGGPDEPPLIRLEPPGTPPT
jgi:hypothetical protein